MMLLHVFVLICIYIYMYIHMYLYSSADIFASIAFALLLLQPWPRRRAHGAQKLGGKKTRMRHMSGVMMIHPWPNQMLWNARWQHSCQVFRPAIGGQGLEL